MKCYICGNEINLTDCEVLQSHCQFRNIPLVRYKCPICHVVFGSIEMINSTPEQLREYHQAIYQTYTEMEPYGLESIAFNQVFTEPTGTYLNFGCGKYNNTTRHLRSMGYDVYSYEPFSSYDTEYEFLITDPNQLNNYKFDGIFSNNVLDHLQNPYETLCLLKSTLKNEKSTMCHKTDAYQYNIHWTSFHLFFFLDNSVQFLADRIGMKLNQIGDSFIFYNE